MSVSLPNPLSIFSRVSESQRHDAQKDGRQHPAVGSPGDCATRSLMQPKAPCATRPPCVAPRGERKAHTQRTPHPEVDADSRLHSLPVPQHLSYFAAATACRATATAVPSSETSLCLELLRSCLPIPASASGYENHAPAPLLRSKRRFSRREGFDRSPPDRDTGTMCVGT